MMSHCCMKPGASLPPINKHALWVAQVQLFLVACHLIWCYVLHVCKHRRFGRLDITTCCF